MDKRRKYTSWRCDKCNLTLVAKNKIKLAKLINVHLEYHKESQR